MLVLCILLGVALGCLIYVPVIILSIKERKQL